MPVGRSQSDLRPYLFFSIGDVVIPTWQYVTNFTAKVATQDLTTVSGTMSLFDPDWDYLEFLVMRERHDPKLTIQWGWEHGEVSPVYNARYLNVTPSFAAQGVTINLEWITTEFTQLPQNYSFPAGTRISDIVRDLANKEGWSIGRIEATRAWQYPINSTGLTLRQFVNQLADIAVNEQGMGAYRAYFEYDKFYFVSAISSKERKIYRRYTLYGDQQGDLIEFSVGDEINLLGSLGAASGTGRGIDKEEKALYSVTVNESENSDGINRIGDRGRGSSFGSMQAWTDDPNALAARETMRRRYTEISHSYNANMTIMGDPNLPVNEYVRILVFKPNGEIHHLAGLYRTGPEITHSLSTSGYTTSAGLIKEDDPLSVDLLGGKFIDTAHFKQEELDSSANAFEDIATDLSLDAVTDYASNLFGGS